MGTEPSGMTLRVATPNWFEGLRRPRQLGAVATVEGDRVRLVLPPRFLKRWHFAAPPEEPRVPPGLPVGESVAGFAALLGSAGAMDRLRAASAILSLGREADAAIPALLSAMTGDKLASVRWRAVEALRKIGPPPYTLPALAGVLQSDPCRSVRWRAAEALAATSMPSDERAEALVRASADDDHWVRWHADRVLKETIDRDLLQALLPPYATKATNAAVRSYALRLLAAQEHLDRKTLRALVVGLWDPDARVRQHTANLVARHGLPVRYKRARGALELCARDSRPEVRKSAVEAIGYIAHRDATGLPLLQRSLGDPDASVRSAAYRELTRARGGARSKITWLGVGLHDPDLSVRLTSALELSSLKVETPAVISALASTLWQERPPLSAWRSLVALAERHEQPVLAAISLLPPAVISYLVKEDVAAGTLPTIGLRLWDARARIRFPNKEGGDFRGYGLGYPWVHAGVHHSWESYIPPLRSRIPGVVKQVSLAVDSFRYAHLIAAVEYGRYLPPSLSAQTASVHIEGRSVGSIIAGGGVSDLLDVPGTESRAGAGKRLDFLFIYDLQFCQYGAFAATCAWEGSDHPCAARAAASAWQSFFERTAEALSGHGLSEFVDQDWFDPDGWNSSRYGRRQERHYDDLREVVAQLFQTLRSPTGNYLTQELLDIAGRFAQDVEGPLWSAAFDKYPKSLLALLASGIAGSRISFHATQAEELRRRRRDE